MKILLVTVGGSPQPIITAVNSIEPDRVIFICSDGPKGSHSQVLGEGKPCKVYQRGEWPNLPTKLNLGKRFNPESDVICLPNPDEPAECYSIIDEALSTLGTDTHDIVVDYTGGTKSMSAGLAMAALDHGLKIYVTTAERTNLTGVERGEMTAMVSTASIRVMRSIKQLIPAYLRQYNYPAAIQHINEIVRSIELPAETKRQLIHLRNFCTLFDAWDCFDHTTACEYAASFKRYSSFRDSYGKYLDKILASRIAIDSDFKPESKGKQGHGYEIVEDLLSNAERRAAQTRYDDAVGRLYRALELTAQIRLLTEYQIKTGAVPVERLPVDWPRRDVDKSTIELALLDSYRLLVSFTDDPIGKIFQQNQNQLLDSLKIRNNSLFAHGFTPISKENYEIFYRVVTTFIRRAVPAIQESWQFPKEIPADILSKGDSQSRVR